MTTLKREEIQNGIAQGKRAVRDGRGYSHAAAKRLLSKHHAPDSRGRGELGKMQ